MRHAELRVLLTIDCATFPSSRQIGRRVMALATLGFITERALVLGRAVDMLPPLEGRS